MEITIGKKKVKEYTPSIYVSEAAQTDFSKSKGEVFNPNIKFPEELGVEHPFPFELADKLYKKGITFGVVNKFVDFIVGPGIYVTSEDKRAQEIIETFITDTDFDIVLREWVKEALKKNGFLELGGDKKQTVQGLKVLDAKYMYVNRDDKGTIEGYNQYKGAFKKFDKQKIQHFKDHEIAHLSFNRSGDEAYGIGIVWPAVPYINSLHGNEKSMCTLIKRKANAPIHAKIGDAENMPTQEAVDAFGQGMEVMHEKTEFATDYLVNLSTVDFGKIGEKFDFPIEHDLDMLFFIWQIPEVLMGRGNIPEGLAKVQKEAFVEGSIKSKQRKVEKVVEEKIFRRVLEANGMDAKVRLHFGQPSTSETNERITKITELLKIMNLSPEMRAMLELELAELMGFNQEELLTPEEQREKEENEPEPKVPGQNRNEQKLNKLWEYVPTCQHVHEVTEVQVVEEAKTDYALKEWLGFNYSKYLSEIKKFIRKDGFELARGKTEEEFSAGKLNPQQIDKLKESLEDGFSKGKSVNEMAKDIKENVGLNDLYKIEDGNLKLDKEGNKILQMSKEHRPIIFARSESTRVAAEGAKEHYKQGGIEKYTWISSIGARTCPECEALNGMIFAVTEEIMPPQHTFCRCSIGPVVKLG